MRCLIYWRNNTSIHWRRCLLIRHPRWRYIYILSFVPDLSSFSCCQEMSSIPYHRWKPSWSMHHLYTCWVRFHRTSSLVRLHRSPPSYWIPCRVLRFFRRQRWYPRTWNLVALHCLLASVSAHVCNHRIDRSLSPAFLCDRRAVA